MLNEQLKILIETIKNEKTIALLAPSFPIDFKFPDIIIDLKKIWFNKVVELTYAAKLINMKYRKLIKKNPKKQYICTNCPTVTTYILAKYPKHKDKLVNIASPMVIMSRFVKEEFGEEYKTVFIWPCLAKKIEAKKSWDVDYAITFVELQEIFDEYKNNNLNYCKYDNSNTTESWEPDFDKFYNDYTKIYPLTWAVAKTMHYKWIINQNQILIADWLPDIDKTIKTMEQDTNIIFLDLLSCNGWCIGGPWVISKASTTQKEKNIYQYREYCKKDKIWSKLWKSQNNTNIKFQNNLLN